MWIFWYRRHNNFIKNSPKHFRVPPSKHFFILFSISSKINSHCGTLMMMSWDTFSPQLKILSIEEKTNKIQWLAVDTNSRAFFNFNFPSWFYLSANMNGRNGLIAFPLSAHSTSTWEENSLLTFHCTREHMKCVNICTLEPVMIWWDYSLFNGNLFHFAYISKAWMDLNV